MKFTTLILPAFIGVVSATKAATEATEATSKVDPLNYSACGTFWWPRTCWKYCDGTKAGYAGRPDAHNWCWTDNSITCHSNKDCEKARDCSSACGPTVFVD